MLNKFLLRSAVTGALGGLLFGFDTAVIAGTTSSLSGRFHLTAFQLGFTVSIALWGTVLGAISAGAVGQRLGSRATLRILAILYALSALGCAFAWEWKVLLIARLIGGLGIGGSSVLGPVYITELAPPEYRGRLVGLFQINIVVGIMTAYLSNFIISSFQLGAHEWRWQFGVAALPALLFFLMLFAVPHSPRWLATKGQMDEALQSMHMLGVPDPDAELKTIVESIHVGTSAKEEQLFLWRYRTPILLTLGIAAFNQLSGINAVMYYANDIFAYAGFNRVSGGLQAVVVGAVNLVFTLVAMALIDKLGRRALLLIGSACMTLALSGIAVTFATRRGRETLIYFVAGFIAFFALSSGSVIWVYISEIFPTRVRMKGQALGSTVMWVFNGIIAQAFPVLAARSTLLPFIFFAAAMAVQFVTVLLFFPETKGLALEQLQQKLRLNEA